MRLGSDVPAVDENDSREIGGDAETGGDVCDGAALGDLQLGCAVATVGGEECGERSEESDFDSQRNPPCPSSSTVGRSVTRSRSPGRIASPLSRLFQRRTSLADTP